MKLREWLIVGAALLGSFWVLNSRLREIKSEASSLVQNGKGLPALLEKTEGSGSKPPKHGAQPNPPSKDGDIIAAINKAQEPVLAKIGDLEKSLDKNQPKTAGKDDSGKKSEPVDWFQKIVDFSEKKAKEGKEARKEEKYLAMMAEEENRRKYEEVRKRIEPFVNGHKRINEEIVEKVVSQSLDADQFVSNGKEPPLPTDAGDKVTEWKTKTDKRLSKEEKNYEKALIAHEVDMEFYFYSKIKKR